MRRFRIIYRKLSRNFHTSYENIRLDHPFIPPMNTIPSMININDRKIKELRECNKKLNDLVNTMAESDERTDFITQIADQLFQEERCRPMTEQFPHIRYDVDNLLVACAKLEESTEKIAVTLNQSTGRLERSTLKLSSYVQNKSDQLENIINDGILKWLVTYNFQHIENRTKHFGVFYRRTNSPLVQWDGVFRALKDGKTFLILVEAKETPHVNDIIPTDTNDENKTLLCRSKKTLDLYHEIQGIDFNRTRTSNSYKTQAMIFEDISKIIVVLASSKIRDDLMKAVKSLNNKIPSNDTSFVEFRCADIDFELNFEC